MKRFIAILCVLVLIPLYCFAANSPTLHKTISMKPKLTYFFADKTVGWTDVLQRLEEYRETDGYIMLDAFSVFLDKKYKKVTWSLSIPLTEKDAPFVLLIDDENIIKREVKVTDNGKLIIDFSDLSLGFYYICFYIKGA